MPKSKVSISNVDQDGFFEVIIYEGGEKVFQKKVEQFDIDLIPGAMPSAA